MITREHPHTIAAPTVIWTLRLAGAGLLIASGIIHMHLWDIAYRNVHVLNVLFLIQAVACFVLAAALMVTRRLWTALVALAGAALAAGTIVGFLLARTTGLFGFKLTFSSGLANTVLIVEAAAALVLLSAAWLIYRAAPARR